jgi:hypothetical protein
MEKLHVEVDGLYAGINLLNDMEPDEDNRSDTDGSDIVEDDLENNDSENHQPADGKRPPPQSEGNVPASTWTDLKAQIRNLYLSVDLESPMEFRRYTNLLQPSIESRVIRLSCSACKDDTFNCGWRNVQDHPPRRLSVLGSPKRTLSLSFRFSKLLEDNTMPPPKIFRDKTMAGQSRSLQKIRGNFKSFHRRFLKACKSSDKPEVR